jgi:FkbM family methyltransferase
MNYIIYFVLPRVKFLFKKQNTFFQKILFLYRLILLLLIILFFNKKKFFFFGKFGNKKFKIFLDTLKSAHGTRGYYLLRNKQEPLLEFGHKLFKPGDIVIDGGANQGVFSLSFRSVIQKKGLIISVEPFKYATQNLKLNFLLNNFHNYIIYQNTLSDKNKKNKIYYSDKITDASILIKKENYKMINSITIDKIIKQNSLKKLNFIKLDIEGAEFLALKGAKKTLKKFKPKLHLEINSHDNFAKVYSFLKTYNYSAFIFDNKGNLKKINKFSNNEKNIIFK